MLANAQASFPCPNSFCFEKAFFEQDFEQDSNNPLAVELETENDPAREIFLSKLSDFTSVEAAAPASPTRIYSNVQHVEAYGGALGVDGDDPVRSRRRPIRKPRPMPSAAPSDPNAARTTRPIAPASRRAARRRCSACRKTCRAFLRAARQRCVPSKLRRRRKPKPRRAAKTESAPAAAPKPAAEPRLRQRPPVRPAPRRRPARSQKAKQCAGIRDPKRLPQRLSEDTAPAYRPEAPRR